MTTLESSPSANKHNSFIDRYLKNVEGSNDNLTFPSSPLKPVSPSKLNLNSFERLSPNSPQKRGLSSPITTPSSLKLQKSPLAFSSSKENIKNGPFTSSPLRKTNNSVSINIDISPDKKLGVTELADSEKRYYEFLCRVAEVKQWIEELIGETLPSEVDLCVGDGLRNGVYLARVTQVINPALVPTIVPAGNRVQFKHTQNINAFFTLLDDVGVPESFRFELADLYNKKNLPQVFETLHILISLLNKKWPGRTPELKELSGKVKFSKEDIWSCRRSWPKIRDFKPFTKSSPLPLHSPRGTPSPSHNLSPDFQPSNNLYKSPFTTPTRRGPLRFSDTAQPTSTTTDIQALKPPVLIASPNLRFDSIELSSKYTPDPAVKNFSESEDPISSSKRLTFTPTFRTRTPATSNQNDYSPLKSMSLSYYSPNISHYLAYDSDYYLKRSQIRTRTLQFYDTFSYTTPSPSKVNKLEDPEFVEMVNRIQSYCRSVNLRFNLHMTNRLLDLFKKDIVGFQSNWRGSQIRKRFHLERTLGVVNSPNENSGLDNDVFKCFLRFQALVKALSIRNSLDMKRLKFLRHEGVICSLQAYLSGYLVRCKTKRQVADICALNVPLMKLQSHIRGRIVRNRSTFSMASLNVERIQALIRGLNVRSQCKSISTKVLEGRLLIKLQALMKAKLVLHQFRQLMFRAQEQQNSIINFSSRLHGHKVRRKLFILQSLPNGTTQSISCFQGIVKGVLVRYSLDILDEFVEYNRIHILQAHIRGGRIRTDLYNRSVKFRNNVKAIIRIQSWVRMYLQRSAYLELLQCPNPSLWAVRKFTFLLNDSGIIEDIQDKLEIAQTSLDSQNMKKEILQGKVRRQLDTFAVLKKLKLDRDPVDRVLKDNYKIPQSRYPMLEKFFYLLQVSPLYWETMYLKNPEFTQKNFYLSFTALNKRMRQREKVYYVRLLSDMISLTMAKSGSIQEFLDSWSQTWEKQLRLFLQREYATLFALFLPVLEYLNNPTVDFESDPYEIYRKLYGAKPPSDMSPIDDQNTKDKFIENLRSLWHCVELVAEVLTTKFGSIPTEIKFLCTKIFGYAADKNADEFHSMRAVSKVLVGAFVGEYLSNRSYYNFKDSTAMYTSSKVTILQRALCIVFEMQRFKGYYDPLNQYCEEIGPHIRDLLYSFLVGSEYDQMGDRMIYTDIVTPAPTLEILTDKAREIVDTFCSYLEYFPENNVIHELLNRKNRNITYPTSARVLLELDPSVYRFLAVNDKMRKLYDQTKRAFVYMTQIEEVDSNLYDLAVSTVLPNDEPCFAELLTTYPEVKDDPMIRSLDSLTYFSLKNATLKRIYELENAGLLNPMENRLQNVLNDIANSIKNPNYAVNYLTQELEVTERTVEKLTSMNQQLEAKLSSLKKRISDTISGCQGSRNFTPVHRSAFDNLRSAYRRSQSRDSPDSQGLKFKWTTRQLYEKGVLLSISGERLGEPTVKVFGSSGPKFPEVIFKISTSDGSTFTIQLVDRRKGPERKHADMVDTFDFTDLVTSQVDPKVKTWDVLQKKVTLNTENLLTLIVNTFFS